MGERVHGSVGEGGIKQSNVQSPKGKRGHGYTFPSFRTSRRRWDEPESMGPGSRPGETNICGPGVTKEPLRYAWNDTSWRLKVRASGFSSTLPYLHTSIPEAGEVFRQAPSSFFAFCQVGRNSKRHATISSRIYIDSARSKFLSMYAFLKSFCR
jgi:hypothetical protein